MIDQGVLRSSKTLVTQEGRCQYFGKLPQGNYAGSYEIKAFPDKNSRWFLNQAAASRGLMGEAVIGKSEQVGDIPPTLRNRILTSCYERLEGIGEHSSVAFSLLFGLREGLERELEEGLKELGMLHLFVLSGLHLGIYHRGLLGIGKLLSLPRVVTEVVALGVLIFFCYLSNWHVSALRTLFIAVIRAVSFYLKRKPDTLESLSAVCLLLLWMKPAWAGSLSFLLGTIAYGALKISKKKKLFWMWVALLPLQLLLVERLSLLYILANIILSALSAPILGILMLGFFLPLIQPLIGYLLSGLIRGLYIVRNSSLLRLEMPSPAALTLVTIYLLWFTWLLLREKEKWWKKWKKRGVWVLVAGLILSSLTLTYDREMQKGVIFFDVGQGDASLIITPNGKTILIDTGREEALLRKLRSLGVGEVDILILSHLDDDHSALVDRIPHRELYVPVGIPIGNPLRRGDQLALDGVVVDVLHPKRAGGDENDQSLVLLIESYGRRVLYTGDIGEAVLGTIDATLVDVLKFPHHGAAGSLHAGALDRLQPLVTILSVGRNHYGHPSPRVIEALEERGLRYHSTWDSGNFFFNQAGFRSY